MEALFTYWHLDGLMAVFLTVLCGIYYYLGGITKTRSLVYFFSGIGLIIVSVASPLYFLGENYLMSAHMLSHMILILIAAPLLVMAIPESNKNHFLLKFSVMLSRLPLLPWLAGVCMMWFWHIPAVFNFLIRTTDQPVNDGWIASLHPLANLHLISLILCGMLFSWPIVGPVRAKRMEPLNAVLYLSAACIFCSLLGLLITFAPLGIYTPYIHPADRFGFLHMIRNGRGLSAEVDQQISGLIMWVPGCAIYLTASMILLMKWFREKNEQSFSTKNNSGYGRQSAR